MRDVQETLPGFEPPRPPRAPPRPSIIETPTPEQLAIVDRVRFGSGHLLVEALAGAGKTSTILESLVASTADRVLLTSFGKDIVATLARRMPKAPPRRVWRAKTLHTLGLGVLRSYGWAPDPGDARHGIHKDTSENYVNDVATSIEEVATEDKRRGRPPWFDLPFTVDTHRAVISEEVRRAARDLLHHWKDTRLPHEEVDEEVAEEDDLDAFDGISAADADVARAIAHFAYLMGARLDRTKIDFHDMIWLPLVLDLVPKWPFDLMFVDEAQDLNRPQFEMALRLLKPGGRLVVVGDLNQSMYSWRGAVGDEVWAAMGDMGAVTMPLTVSFRCPQAVVELANELVPDLRARDGAPIGKIYACSFARMIEGLPTTTIDSFVLSRNNARLFETAIQLWSRNAVFSFSKGEELAAGLHALIDQLDLGDVDRFTKSLDEWHEKAIAKAREKKAISKIDRIDQRRDTLLALLTCTEPRGLHAMLDRLTTSRDAVVKLATVHGTKGLEADRVYLLRETFARYQERSDQDSISQEELNIEYVAITRAKRELVWVELPGET
jgi:DNA helicase II / ATP-dependent DNA helicase PcrA